jgi:iron(III) transport system ATP-binding protein
MISVSNLNFKYNKSEQTKIIDGISFSVNKGEIVCLLGPSGCGKTSILRLISGLEIPSFGTISISGNVVSSETVFVEPHKRRVGFLFQDYALFPHLTAQENIAWGLFDLDAQKKNKRIARLLKQTNMEKKWNKYPHELSGGEQQRISLARALAPKPSLILLDEPFSSLDTNLRQDIRSETCQILKNTSTTAIIVTHDPEEAMLIADRIILMNEGKIIQDGSSSELYFSPVDKFAASFFGYVNHLDGIVDGKSIKTIFGNISTTKLPTGTSLDVVARPNSLSLIEIEPNNKKSIIVCVESVKIVGQDTHVWCFLESGQGVKDRILVVLSEMGDIKEGDRKAIILDKDKIFSFGRVS